MTPTMTVEAAATAETPIIELSDVAEQAMDALREDQRLALLGGIGLDDADAAQRLGEPAR